MLEGTCVGIFGAFYVGLQQHLCHGIISWRVANFSLVSSVNCVIWRDEVSMAKSDHVNCMYVMTEDLLDQGMKSWRSKHSYVMRASQAIWHHVSNARV